jgi:hypothetical protein
VAGTVRVRFTATVGGAIKNNIGMAFAGLPAVDCAICFHGFTSGTSAATKFVLSLDAIQDERFFFVSAIAS